MNAGVKEDNHTLTMKEMLEKLMKNGTPTIMLGVCHYFVELSRDNREVNTNNDHNIKDEDIAPNT